MDKTIRKLANCGVINVSSSSSEDDGEGLGGLIEKLLVMLKMRKRMKWRNRRLKVCGARSSMASSYDLI